MPRGHKPIAEIMFQRLDRLVDLGLLPALVSDAWERKGHVIDEDIRVSKHETCLPLLLNT